MNLSNRINPYLTKTGENPALPTIPLNYGVSKKPITIVKIVSIIGILLLTILGGYLLFFTSNIAFIIIDAILIIGLVSVWSMLQLTYKNNVQTTYRNKFILEVMSPWFKNYYNLQLHTDVLSDFMSGTPIFVNKTTYLTPRWDKENKKFYVSQATAEYYANATETLENHPRVLLNPVKKIEKNFIPENKGYEVITVDNQKIIVTVTKK